MTLGEYISNVFLPIVDFVFSMFDQCLEMFFSLKIFGVSIGAVALTIFFVTFILYKVVGKND